MVTQWHLVFTRHLHNKQHCIFPVWQMWLSASAFFAQYFRVYSPIVFGKKYDKDGADIRKWVQGSKSRLFSKCL
jgi:cryptochrome